MALASTGFALNVQMVDAGGNNSAMKFDLVAADFATATADAAIILAAIAAVSGLAIKSYTLAEVFVDAVAGYGSKEAEEIALIVAQLTTAGKTATIRVPGPLDGIFKAAQGPDFNVVDINDADIIAFLSLFESGAKATVSDGEVIKDAATAGNWYGKRVHRGSRKG